MIALAFAAGFLGGAAHLGVTALRARAVTGGSVGLSLLLAPAGLAGPALATVAVLLWHPAGVWALLVGLIAARGLLIRRLGRAVEGRVETLTPPVLVQLGPLGLTETVFVSAALTGVLLVLGLVGARVARAREVAEVIYEFVESMLQDMVTVDVAPVVPLVLTQWLFILSANLVGLLPVVSSPTRDLSLTAALAVVAFGAGHVYGFQAQGWRYLKHYIEPNPIMLPFNVIGEASRTVALALRLFGNMVSGEIVAAIVVSLAGLLLPVPLMLLDVLTSVVQAYIFGVLTLVFTASAMQVAGRAAAPPPPPDGAPS